MVLVTFGTQEILSTAIVHIERDLEDIDGSFEKIQSDITNNITEIDQQKRKFLSDISDMRKSFNVSIQKGAFNYDLYELKLDFPSELESFVKDVSKFGVVNVTEKLISVIRKHQQQFVFLINEYKFAIR
jgi:hypothetical protein